MQVVKEGVIKHMGFLKARSVRMWLAHLFDDVIQEHSISFIRHFYQENLHINWFELSSGQEIVDIWASELPLSWWIFCSFVKVRSVHMWLAHLLDEVIHQENLHI